MANQPLLFLDTGITRSWSCTKGPLKHQLYRISFVGARLYKYQTNCLLSSLLGRPIRQTSDLLNYQGVSVRTSNNYLTFLSRRGALGFFYYTTSTTLLVTSYYLRLPVIVKFVFFCWILVLPCVLFLLFRTQQGDQLLF